MARTEVGPVGGNGSEVGPVDGNPSSDEAEDPVQDYGLL